MFLASVGFSDNPDTETAEQEAAREVPGQASVYHPCDPVLDLPTIFDSVPNPVFIKDENLRFIFVNKAYEKMFGVKMENILGKSVLDLDYLSLEERRFYQREDKGVMGRKKIKRHIFNYRHRGKKIHTCLYWSSGFVQENGIRGLIGVIVDINRQSRAIHDLRKKLRFANSEKKDVAERSKIDPLTGLYNRGTFDDDLRKWTSSQERAFSCIMLDIDHFKRVNDTFGHIVGDAVIRETADALKKCSRNRDMAYRYGGEEFVVLLPGGTLKDSMKVAERIRHLVSTDVRMPDGKNITISAGCSEYGIGESGVPVIQRADQALYAAKESGRNRVCTIQAT